jgi:hypothetical protein
VAESFEGLLDTLEATISGGGCWPSQTINLDLLLSTAQQPTGPTNLGPHAPVSWLLVDGDWAFQVHRKGSGSGVAVLDVVDDRSGKVVVSASAAEFRKCRIARRSSSHPMNASDFGAHSKRECALHRWDLVGSDSVSMELLADPALTVHATHVLTEMPTLRESIGRRIAARAGGNASHRVVLRSLPADDVVVSSSPGGATTLALEPPTDEPATLDLHAADRLLVLWGRRPAGIVPGSLLDNASIRLLAGG